MASEERRDLLASPGHRTLAELTRLGSQTGSQRQQTSGHTRRQRAMVSPASWPIRPCPATCSDAAYAPEKRKAGGSTPPLTTVSTITLRPSDQGKRERGLPVVIAMTDSDGPCLSAGRRALSHADRTPDHQLGKIGGTISCVVSGNAGPANGSGRGQE